MNKGLILMSIDLAERYLDEAHNTSVDEDSLKTYEHLHKAMDVIIQTLNVLANEGDEFYER